MRAEIEIRAFFNHGAAEGRRKDGEEVFFRFRILITAIPQDGELLRGKSGLELP